MAEFIDKKSRIVKIEIYKDDSFNDISDYIFNVNSLEWDDVERAYKVPDVRPLRYFAVKLKKSGKLDVEIEDCMLTKEERQKIRDFVKSTGGLA